MGYDRIFCEPISNTKFLTSTLLTPVTPSGPTCYANNFYPNHLSDEHLVIHTTERPTAANHTHLLYFNKMSGRLRNCFSPAYAARILGCACVHLFCRATILRHAAAQVTRIGPQLLVRFVTARYALKVEITYRMELQPLQLVYHMSHLRTLGHTRPHLAVRHPHRENLPKHPLLSRR